METQWRVGPQKREMGFAIPRNIRGGKKLGIEILRCKAERGRLITSDDLHQISRTQTIDRAKDPFSPMIIGGNGQGPITEELTIFTQETGRGTSGHQGIPSLVDGIGDAKKLSAGIRHELPHTDGTSRGTGAHIKG